MTTKTVNENKPERMRLNNLEVKGFKSISHKGEKIDFGDITVLLGANGAGKSNLVSFFKMLNFITTEGLQVFLGKQGGTESLLYYGPKHTDKIEFTLAFQQGANESTKTTNYSVKLSHGMPDKLFFAHEQIIYKRAGAIRPQEYFTDNGVNESGLSKDTRVTSKVLLAALNSIRTYQFHDTSDTAKIKASTYVDDARYLRSDAGNLAAFLRLLKNEASKSRYYERIIRHIRKVMPQFGDFDLETLPFNDKYVTLNWREHDSDYIFGPHQISDGSLRFMALTALLLQPPEMLPQVIVLDEPELGLHPAAIGELAGMIRTASKNAQIVIATQSTRLVDEFGCDNLVIVERDEAHKCSVFKRLDQEKLAEWLQNYSLSELWEKNVLGGRP